MGRPVVYWELMSKDPAQVALFYERVFGWKIQERPEIDYRRVDTGTEEGINGGIVKPRDGALPGNLTMYVDVDDLAPYRQRIVDAGGKILVDEQEVFGRGWLTLFADPDERIMGLWKDKKP
jgi:predicted enzyme related to lactoylglutathione lyase